VSQVVGLGERLDRVQLRPAAVGHRPVDRRLPGRLQASLGAQHLELRIPSATVLM
jgi:hypothetical protein